VLIFIVREVIRLLTFLIQQLEDVFDDEWSNTHLPRFPVVR
jgi:hypothetical protein